MKEKLPRILDLAAVAVLLAAAFFAWRSGSAAAASTASQPVASNAVRIEIQRYMGYEILPVRYLSLPYDITMNTNEQVAFLDIGALLLMFVPVLVLWGFARKPLQLGLVLLSCLFLLVISTANGNLLDTNLGLVKPTREALGEYLSATAFADAPTGVICAHAYQALLGVYAGIHPLFAAVSGDSDAVTYALLLGCFGLFFWLSAQRFEGKGLVERSLMAFMLVYVFFWLMLSSGIVWYGILAFPVLTAMVFCSAERRGSSEPVGKVVFYGFGLFVGLFVLMGFVQRLSNIKIQNMEQDPISGKRIFDPALLKYQTGDFTEKQVVDAYYPGLPTAIEMMNRERQRLIYNVGTRFNYFITENDRRVFKDNQLDFFDQIIAKHTTKAGVTELLKKSGFGYFLVDFNTPTTDKTPEQALATRFQKLMVLFRDNPGMELVATNRVLKETVNGQTQLRPGVFGEVYTSGSYAVYRIK